MVKATQRSAVLLGFFASAMLLASMPALAEVQNVKVGGDLTVRGFYRRNLDLHDERSSATKGLDQDQFFTSTTGVNVGADLTENVSTFFRLVNERDWNTASVGTTGTNNNDVALSQAYVTLKELFYSPLTLKIGRQPIVWGRGFILGSGLVPATLQRGDDIHTSFTPNEFTDFTAFDAFRATLDLSGVGGMGFPLTAEYVYIKLVENNVGQNDDVNLQGVNFGTRFDKANSEVEAYLLNKRDKSSAVNIANKPGSITTMGVRGSTQPGNGCMIWGELAYQFGKRVTDPSSILTAGKDTQGWAANLGLEHTFTGVAMTPKIGAEWRYYSGRDLDGAVPGWSIIAPGYFTTALREFQTASSITGFYPNDQQYFRNGANGAGTGAQTNQNEFGFFGSLKPIEDLTISPRLSFFVLPVGAYPVGPDGVKTTKRKHYAGTEWDTNVVYNYTDDVQFGLLYALFASGDVYRRPNDSTAQELISSVSVKF